MGGFHADFVDMMLYGPAKVKLPKLALVQRELQQTEWALRNIRASQAYMSQINELLIAVRLNEADYVAYNWAFDHYQARHQVLCEYAAHLSAQHSMKLVA